MPPVLLSFAGRLKRSRQHVPELGPPSTKAVHRAGLDQPLDSGAVDDSQVDPLTEIEEVFERPLVPAGAGDVLGSAAADAFDRRQPEENLAVGDFEISAARIDAGRQYLDTEPAGIVDVVHQAIAFVAVLDLAR